MNKKILLLSVITMLALTSKAQRDCDCFNRLDNLGMYYERIGNNLMALSAYKDALIYGDSNVISERHYVNVARLYYKFENLDSSSFYLAKALQHGYDTTYLKLYYPSVMQLKSWPSIKALQKVPTNFNMEVYKSCIIQVALDQSIRTNLLHPSIWAKGELEKYQQKLAIIIGRRIDSSSTDLLLSILNSYGYPSYNKLGFSNSFYFNLLAMHTSDWKRNIIARLEKLNVNCDYPYKSDILFYMDRNCSVKGYTIAGLYGPDRFIKIPNINTVDSIRFEFNQLRIKEDSYKNGEIVPSNYIPHKYPDNYFCSKKYQFD